MCSPRTSASDSIADLKGQRFERHERLRGTEAAALPMAEIIENHKAGVDFKLHPFQSTLTQNELQALHARVAANAWAVWVWLEEKRLGIPAGSPLKYGQSGNKCPETFGLKNALIRLRAFGVSGVMNPLVFRYPREALLNTLPLLLWAPELAPGNAAWLSQQLVAPVAVWTDAVAAYARLWARYN